MAHTVMPKASILRQKLISISRWVGARPLLGQALEYLIIKEWEFSFPGTNPMKYNVILLHDL